MKIPKKTKRIIVISIVIVGLIFLYYLLFRTISVHKTITLESDQNATITAKLDLKLVKLSAFVSRISGTVTVDDEKYLVENQTIKTQSLTVSGKTEPIPMEGFIGTISESDKKEGTEKAVIVFFESTDFDDITIIVYKDQTSTTYVSPTH